jgi:Na+-transporting NADH:ubiquinone oxidoreductase subunit NqrE
MPTVTVTKTRTKTISDGEVPVTQSITVNTPEVEVAPLPTPNVGDIVLFGAVVAVVAFGLTGIVKSFIQDMLKLKGKAKPWYYLTLIRVCCISFGGCSAWLMQSSFGPFSTAFAVGVGCAAGVLSTTIVAAVKKRIKASA